MSLFGRVFDSAQRDWETEPDDDDGYYPDDDPEPAEEEL